MQFWHPDKLENIRVLAESSEHHNHVQQEVPKRCLCEAGIPLAEPKVSLGYTEGPNGRSYLMVSPKLKKEIYDIIRTQ